MSTPDAAPDLDLPRDLPAAVFMVPDAHWGFWTAKSIDHPGACLDFYPDWDMGQMVQGTDEENVRKAKTVHVVEPSAENGLSRATGFKLSPRLFRSWRLRLYFPGRFLGRLAPTDTAAIIEGILRLNPEEEPPCPPR